MGGLPGGTAPDAAGQAGATRSWLVENLLVLVTAVLALIVFIVAWALRRAGARRTEDDDVYDYGEPLPESSTDQAVDQATLNRRLEGISLDLDQPPTDEAPRGRRT